MKKAWSWIPTLYFAEGTPYIIAMTVSVIMYKRLGVSNSEIAFYTSWLYLPWVIKPLWSPVVDLLKTKRWWIVTTQFFLGAFMGGVALTIPAGYFFQYTLLFFWLIAFSSATHDIAADGFYMLALREKDQSFFIGIRSVFYRFAMLAGQGLLVIFAGQMEERFGNVRTAWQLVFAILAAALLLFSLYHKFILPKSSNDKPTAKSNDMLKEFLETFILFFKKEKIIIIITFILFYRFGEAQLAKLAAPFLLDSKEVGGLAMSTTDVGFIYGTVGLIALMLGGIIGGAVASKKGLKYWLFWMLIAINVPDAVYIYLSYVQPESLTTISALVALEQFGYGFGFTAFMLYMIYVSEGERKTAHYAIATGIMALGMMLPGMFSGMVQEALGYKMFFVWVMVATVPSFAIAKFIPLDPEFGKK